MTEYHDRAAETMPREKLDALQEKLLRTICGHAWRSSGFYRDLWSGAGLRSGLVDRRDLARLPFTSKEDLVESFPYRLCCVPREELARIYLTSGSSGRPTGTLLSRNDLEAATDLAARSLMARGVRRGDVVQITLAYGLWAAAFTSHCGAERLGCLVIPSGAGNTQRQLWLMRTMGTTALDAVPSYHLRIAEVGEAEGFNFSSLPLRVALSVAGRLEPAVRRQIEDRLQVEGVYNCYGLTEVGGVGYECGAHEGLHSWHDECLLEVVDPATGEVLGPGERGEFVVTTLRRFAMPLIRYRTGDTGSVLSEEKCPCGRTHLRISEEVDRLDESVKIRGVLVSPRAIESHLKSFPQLSGRFVLQVGPGPEARLVCEMVPSEKPDARELGTALAAHLKDGIGLTLRIKLVGQGGLPPEAGEKKVQVIPGP